MPNNALSLESWRVLRIQGEFVEAIDALSNLPPWFCVDNTSMDARELT